MSDLTHFMPWTPASDTRIDWTDEERQVGDELETDDLEYVQDMIEMVRQSRNKEYTRCDWYYDVHLKGKDAFPRID